MELGPSRANLLQQLTEHGLGIGETPLRIVFGLETDANDYRSPLSVGSFSWGGAFNTHYWADPEEHLVGLIYTNIYNTQHWNIGDRFKVLTYQAIER